MTIRRYASGDSFFLTVRHDASRPARPLETAHRPRRGPGRSARRRRCAMVGRASSLVVVAAAAWFALQPRGCRCRRRRSSRPIPSQQFVLLNATGYVVAQRKAAISSKATGRLEWLGVAEGSRVKAGDIIARIDARDVVAQGAKRAGQRARARKAALEQALGRGARRASRNYKRNQDLRRRRASSRHRRVDTAKARAESAHGRRRQRARDRSAPPRRRRATRRSRSTTR